MSESLIDLDEVGEIIVEIPARADLDLRGRPYLVPLRAERWTEGLTRCVGREMRVVLIRDKRRRTSPQNRYLWGVAYIDVLNGMKERAIEVGLEPPFNSKDDVHNWAKFKFLRTLRVFPGGEEEEVPGSTRKLSTKEFSDYVEAIAIWASQRGVYVRRPNEAMAA